MLHFEYNDFDKSVYEKELESFLPKEFTDFHVHLYDKNDTQRVTGHNGGATWVDMLTGELSVEQLRGIFATMFPKNKVDALVFGSCDHDVYKSNEFIKTEAKKHGLPALLRTDYDMTGDYLEETVKKGGFLGLKPYLTFCPPYIPSAEVRIFDYLPHEHLEAANKNGWIVMLHIPRSKRLKDEVNIAQLMEIENRYPNVRLVVAHVGRAYSKQDIGDAFETLKNTKNMYFDFTANVCDDAIKACIEAVGTKRLIFGSDLPIATLRMFRTTDETGFYYNNLPRGLYGEEFDDPHVRITDREDVTLMMYEQIRALKRVATDMKLKDTDIEDIMNNNAKRLLKSV